MTSSLPYIDPPPTEQQQTVIDALIASELRPVPQSSQPPKEYTPLAALDLARYTLSPSSSLPQLAVLHSYSLSRLDNLALLAGHGQHAWIVANYLQESTLRSLIAHRDALKLAIDNCNRSRKQQQLAALESSLDPLSAAWSRLITNLLHLNAALGCLE